MKENKQIFDCIIIGSGPAGMSAAIYLGRAENKIAIFEKEAPGGKMIKTETVENYPGYKNILGIDLSIKMHDQVNKYNPYYIYEKVALITKDNLKNEFIIKTSNNNLYYAKTVIIATGTIERKVGALNEDTFYGKGVSYCAVCDGALYKNADIAVIGGGLAACEGALYLTKFAKKITLIHRREQFRFTENMLKKLKDHKKITINTNYILKEIIGNNKVNKIKIENTLDKTVKFLEVAAVFIYIGANPITKFINNLNITDSEGYIITNKKAETKIKGLFAAGDATTTSLRQIATAISDGAIAAQYAIAYIDNLK